MRRFDGLLLLAIGMATCAGESAPERPAPSEIPRAEALRIAFDAIGESRAEDDPFLHAEVGRILGPGPRRWQVSYSNPLGGGWTVSLDARSGEVLEIRRLPGR